MASIDRDVEADSDTVLTTNSTVDGAIQTDGSVVDMPIDVVVRYVL